MLNIRNTQGNIADVIRAARDIPARVIPYAASTAMTRVASRAAKTDLPAAMNRSFDRPTRWTLNSLAITPASRDKLSARIFVKDAAAKGTVPEKYLVPEVEGGQRRKKRFERALWFAGVLDSGERIMPGRQITLDANGNMPTALINSVLAWARSGAGPKAKASGRGASRVKAQNPRGYFLFGKPGGVRGVAQRSGAIFMPVMIFTKTQPVYRPLLDFTGVAEQTARTHFGPEFNRAAADILARPR